MRGIEKYPSLKAKLEAELRADRNRRGCGECSRAKILARFRHRLSALQKRDNRPG